MVEPVYIKLYSGVEDLYNLHSRWKNVIIVYVNSGVSFVH